MKKVSNFEMFLSNDDQCSNNSKNIMVSLDSFTHLEVFWHLENLFEGLEKSVSFYKELFWVRISCCDYLWSLVVLSAFYLYLITIHSVKTWWTRKVSSCVGCHLIQSIDVSWSKRMRWMWHDFDCLLPMNNKY